MLNWFKYSQQNMTGTVAPNYNGAVMPGMGSIPTGMPQYSQGTQSPKQINSQQGAQMLNAYSNQLKKIIISSGIPGANNIAAMITSVGEMNKGIFSALPINNLPNNIGGELVSINSKMIEIFNNIVNGFVDPKQIQSLRQFIKQRHDKNYYDTTNILKHNSSTKKASSSDDCFNQNQGMMKEKIHQMIPMLEEMKEKISDSDNIEGWELEHITTAHDDILEVYSYMNQKYKKIYE